MNIPTSFPAMPTPDRLSVRQAQERILASLPERILESEKVALSQANDRILAENIISPIDVPAFNSAAMDGFAFNATSINCSKDQILKIVQYFMDGLIQRKL